VEVEQQTEPADIPETTLNPFSYYGFAFGRLWKYFLELLLVTIISFLISLPTIGWLDEETIKAPFDPGITVNLVFFSFEGWGALVFLVTIFVLLFEWPLEYGISYVHLKAARKEKVAVKDMFAVFNNYWNSVFANLLVTFIIGFGFMLLIIPGIIFACKLCFVPYLVVDKQMDAVEAVKESWRMTSGYSFTIFLTGFLVIFVALFGLLLFGIGIILAVIWIRLTFASIYYAVSEETKQLKALN
jgi:uncharacterized membrane protein